MKDKELRLLDARNAVSRNRRRRAGLALTASAGLFLLVGAHNPVVASAEEVTPVTTSEVTTNVAEVYEMVWVGEFVPAINTDAEGTSEIDVVSRGGYQLVVTNEDYPLISSNIEMIMTDYAENIKTDAEIKDGIYPTDFLNLTAYSVKALNDFTINSAGETYNIDSNFIIYVPSIVNLQTGYADFSGGPLYLQNVDVDGNPTGPVYEVDGSNYYPVEGGNVFNIPAVINGVEGAVEFTKKSGDPVITDAIFLPYDEYLDSDGDYIPDVEEIELYFTDPFNPDSDGDGIIDGIEAYAWGTDPNMPDPDADGDMIPDAIEEEYGLNPDSNDSDGDGLTDYDEFFEFGTDPTTPDTDGDGLTDGEEIEIGTDPWMVDTDMDGLTDGAEVNTYGTDPLNFDTDGDGISDGVEAGMPAGETPDGEEPESEKPDELAYTGNTTHVGGVVGASLAALFLIFKRRG